MTTTVKIIKAIKDEKGLNLLIAELEKEFGQLISIAPIVSTGPMIASSSYVSHYCLASFS